VADDVEHRYPVGDADIITVIKGAPQGSDAKRQREEHKRAREELEEKNAALSHRKGRRKGKLLCKPQPDRDVFPTPAACPEKYDHIVIECGSGTANLGFHIYQMENSRLVCTQSTGMQSEMRILSGTSGG
jgi:hypothetical protein